MKVKIRNTSNNPLPKYETAESAGMDLRAGLKSPIVLRPMQRELVPTGLYIELPPGTEGQVRPRSGLAFKKGVTVLNAPGTVDSDYRGELKVILINLSDQDLTIENGDRIAQLVVARHEQIEFENAEELSVSERGAGGFGHTGNN